MHVTIDKLFDVIRKEYPMEVNSLVVYFNKNNEYTYKGKRLNIPEMFEINGKLHDHDFLSKLLKLQTRCYHVKVDSFKGKWLSVNNDGYTIRD